ncbi:MAG: hypothetical protein H6661_13605 [Ardenticatenaceae bacterium]|nr:hypothetical protein [Ardenticatenaceae bacterium]
MNEERLHRARQQTVKSARAGCHIFVVTAAHLGLLKSACGQRACLLPMAGVPKMVVPLAFAGRRRR